MAKIDKDLRQRLSRAENIIEALRSEDVDAVLTRSNVALLQLRETEKKLCRSEERLRLATEIGKIGTCYLDLPSRQFEMSEQCRRIYGLPLKGEVTVGQLLDRVHPGDRSRVENTLKIASESPVEFENEYRVVHPDGSEHWVSTRCKSFQDDRGEMGFNIGMAVDITARKIQEQQLIEFNQTLEKRVRERTEKVESQAAHLRALATRLTRVEHEERKRLAGILHDQVQQLLVGARMTLGAVKRCVDGDCINNDPGNMARMTLGAVKRCARLDQIRAFAENIDETLGQALQITRSLGRDLTPPALQEGGLCAGLKWLAAHMHKTNNVTLHLDLAEQAEPDTRDTRILLFESARELVLNAVKHAGVSEVRIILEKTREHGLVLKVVDEGRGFDPEILETRASEEATFGLFHIRERLDHIGGRVTIASAPHAGTCITLCCPLQDA